MRIVVPRDDENAVVGLQHEILLHVVDDEGAVQVAAQTAHVLDEDGAPGQRVLAVEPVVDEPPRVDLVDHPVRVILGRSREDDELEAEVVHPLEELVHARADVVVAHAVVLEVMDQRLVQVQHERVGVRGHGRQHRVLLEIRQHRRQRLEPNDTTVLRELIAPVPHVGVLRGPRAIGVALVGVQQGPEGHVLQHPGPDRGGPLPVQGRASARQDVVDHRQHAGLRPEPPGGAGEARPRARRAVAQRSCAAAAQGRPLRGSALTELADNVDDHLVVLPQCHDMLTAPEPPVALDADENVEVQVLRAMDFLSRLEVVLQAVRLVFLHPPLADQVQQHQAVLVCIIQEVPQTRPDGHGDARHHAGAQVRRHAERQALEDARLLNLPLQPLLTVEPLERQLRLRAAAAPVLPAEERRMGRVGPEPVQDVPERVLGRAQLLDYVEQPRAALLGRRGGLALAGVLAVIAVRAYPAHGWTARGGDVLV
mmetsp:Transcript_11146/g.33025  ORF Transcript_11146/g.33025 Transcript_11146/m.33025 type:complete len:481 (+) Transcript_11146:709-2151(+)